MAETPKCPGSSMQWSLVLDHKGTSRRALGLLHGMGVTVHHSTMHKRKKQLLQKQEELVVAQVHTYRKLVEKVDAAEKSLAAADCDDGTAIVWCNASPPIDCTSSCNSTNLYRSAPYVYVPKTAVSINLDTGANISGFNPFIHLTVPSLSGIHAVQSTSGRHHSVPQIVSSEKYGKYKESRQPSVSEGTFGTSIGEVLHNGDGYRMADQKATMKYAKYAKYMKYRSQLSEARPYEIIGDNFDILVSPNKMSIDQQRKSWHWFLLVTTQKRITGHHLPNDKPIVDNIRQFESQNWLPSPQDIAGFEAKADFHITQCEVPDLLKGVHLNYT